MTATARNVPRILAAAAGTALVVEALVGFGVATFVPDAADPGQGLSLLHFDVWYNTFRLLVGLIGLAMASRALTARIYGWGVAVGYGTALVYEPDLEFFRYNTVDHIVHSALLVLGLLIALWPTPKSAAVPVGNEVQR